MDLLLAAAFACLYAEFVGYWLHVLLHSNRIEYLSRSHMIHHLIIYAPDKPQRQSSRYLLSTYGRANVLGVGLEWLGPIAVLLGLSAAGLRVLGASWPTIVVFCAVALGWGASMFWYMHDAMHLQGFWMENARSNRLRRWFLRARHRHDIHHMDLTDDGRMSRNFGICFFGFDALFGSLLAEHNRFNHAGLTAARKRYAYIFPGEQSA